MTFLAAVNGATTSGSNYARSELREMVGTDRAAWNLTTGGIMTATLEVDAAPTRFDGSMGKVVVGQIHGQNDELVRLYWDSSNLYFANDQSGSANTENKFYFYNSSGQQPNVSYDEKFSYVIDAKGSDLIVSVYADGDIYTSATKINSVWQSDTFYFKAGTYLGVNETQGTGYGQTSFYDLRFNHTDTALTPSATGGGGTGPTAPTAPAPTAPTPPAPTPQPDSLYVLPVTTSTVSGSTSNNYVQGNSANNLMYGFAGRDVFWGREGSDIMWGGADSDADGFVFDTAIGRDIDVIMDFNPAHDNIRLDNSIFTKLTATGQLSAGNFALNQARDSNDYIIYDQASGALAYDPDGSGSGSAIVFAQINNFASLSAEDFEVLGNTASTLVPEPTAPAAPAPTPQPDSSFILPVTSSTVSGSAGNNYVQGSSANNLMYGFAGRDVFWGREGSDIMWGGDDSDADGFVFNTAIGRDIDVIMDFKPVDDYIRLENAVFTQLTATGQLSAGNFAINEAKDANDYVIYDQASGALAYDADGSGGGSAIVFAHINNLASLSAGDFFII